MKKIFPILPVAIIVLLAATGCKKSFSDLYQNPNKPGAVPASLLFTGLTNSMKDVPGNSNEIWSQYYIFNYDYYGNNRYDFGSDSSYYYALGNVLKMEDAAIKSGGNAINPYNTMGKFFRAFFFVKTSMQVGDIPMTDALKGLDNLTPTYNTQKDVFKQAFLWLDTANTNITQLINKPDLVNSSDGQSLKGDIFLNNDLSKWQKVINTYRLRLLIYLSKKAGDADLNIAQQFNNIISNPTKYPIMQDASDNLQYVFISPSNYYPDNKDNYGQNGSRKNMSATHIGLLTQLNDPRVYVVAEPSRYQVDTLHNSPTSFTSFVGADPGLDLGIMYNNAGLQRYSFLNRKRYYSGYTAESCIQLGYPELCFNIAEAINRGWITGNAETYYIAGIKASLEFYGIPSGGGFFNAYFFRPGSSDLTSSKSYDVYPINFDWNTYYTTQASVKYDGNTAKGLTQVLQQKYLALFRHSGLESYYTYRRTGIPAFTTGPGTGNSSRIALRFKYPASESSANTKNYQAALQSQYSGNDDINGVMWILK